MNTWVDEVTRTIQRKELFRRGESILVAVSGGLDSMVLLHLLAKFAPSHEWQISVAHFNHQLRGRSGDADEKLVAKTTAKLQLNFISERGDVKKFASANRLSIEMAARQLRHEFFARTANQLGIKTIALAHHADDQVELFFLRLFRGAGGEGLAGMKWKSRSPMNPKLQLVRPLLDQTKENLRDYAQSAGISFREDASNLCLDFRRNRIRRELIPLLKKEYQPALEQTILRTMEIVGAEWEAISKFAIDRLKRSKTAFSRLPIAVQRQYLRQQLLAKKIRAEFDLVEFLRTAPGKVFNVNRDCSVSRDHSGKIRIKQLDKNRFANEQEARVEVSGEKGGITFDGLEIKWSVATKHGCRIGVEENCEFFDAEKLGHIIFLRHWKVGDRFQPIGMNAPVKLQDLFTNLKIAREERHKRIIATTERGEVFWVEGMRISESFKLDKGSGRRLKWEWLRL